MSAHFYNAGIPFPMRVSDFQFELPDRLIARHPLAERRASRLLCLDGPTGELAHRQFTDLLNYLRPGDLMGSGTISGPAEDSRGCLLEKTWRGTNPIKLPTGEERKFLADGDTVIMRGWCERDGFRRIGVGECRGEITIAAE